PATGPRSWAMAGAAIRVRAAAARRTLRMVLYPLDCGDFCGHQPPPVRIQMVRLRRRSRTLKRLETQCAQTGTDSAMPIVTLSWSHDGEDDFYRSFSRSVPARAWRAAWAAASRAIGTR